MARVSYNMYSGEFTLDKLIFYHEKESWMGSYRGDEKRASFHEKAAKLLKQIKEKENEKAE